MIFQSAKFFLVTIVKIHVFYLRNSLLLDMNVVFLFFECLQTELLNNCLSA